MAMNILNEESAKYGYGTKFEIVNKNIMDDFNTNEETYNDGSKGVVYTAVPIKPEISLSSQSDEKPMMTSL